MHSVSAAQATSAPSKSDKDSGELQKGAKGFVMPKPNPKALVDMIEVMELVGTDPEKRNYKGIVIAVLVILLVFSFITIAVYFVTPKNEKDKLGDPFQLEYLFDKDFKPKRVNTRWLPDKDVFIYRSQNGEILARDVQNDTSSPIMDNSTFIQLDSDVYYVSEDLQFVLIAFKIQKMYRHSFVSEYKIYNRFAKEPSEKLLKFPQDINGSWQDKPLQYAGWSSRGHALTFVYENNLYYQKDPFLTPVKLTQTGSDTILNGLPDWLYEEEIFHSRVSHWFSPSSKYICYTQTDDSAVPVYTYPWYGSAQNMESQFRTVRYPKAGDQGSDILPIVRLFLLDTESGMSRTHKELQPPAELANQEKYVTQVKWLNADLLLVVWSNRPQNVSYISHYNARTEDFNLNYVQKSTGGWVEISKIMPVDGGERYLTILPQRDYKSEYYKHLAVTTISKTSSRLGLATFLTQGSYDVTEVVGYDQQQQYVYYIATDGDPRTRHLFRTSLPSGDETMPGMKTAAPHCITCSEADCMYVSAEFSPSAKHYVLHCEGPIVPYTLLRSVMDPDKETMLENNALLQEHLENVAMPVVENFTITADDGHDIIVRVILPPLLNKEHITLYPMLVHTYGAPGSQKIHYKFHVGWENYLVTRHNVISVEVDGHGSGGRGEKLLHSVYKKLGVLEVQDQIKVATYLREKYSFIDRERIAIWGWSYGGFVTAHAVGDKDSDVFSCGIAVAPVTDWRYYDTAYTEKYMGLASEIRHYVQYNDANVSEKAQYFAGKNIMLVHGTADDNVHYQHTAQFVNALTEAGVDFRTQIYTDQNHGLGGDKTHKHLYSTMTNFLLSSCWHGGKPRELHDGEYTEIEYSQLAIR